MRLKTCAAVIAISGLGAPGLASAQQLSGEATSVTFTLPVKLTQLPPDLERVRLSCFLTSLALRLPSGPSLLFPESLFRPVDDVLVTSGQLITTMKVVYWLPVELFDNPIGKTAEYECGLQGYSKALQRWDILQEAATAPVFTVKPTPQAKGSFVW
jgi:hypothetical protein